VLPDTFNPDLVKIDKNTGALSLTYPITVPPGRNGLQPDVSLQYSSQDTKLNSIFGEGWSSKIPYIERLNKMGVDKLYSTSTPNYFISSLDGELATSTPSSTYVARTENGAFNKYTFLNNSWTMTDKNGTTYTFGSSTQSQMNDPNNTGNVYRWMLEQVKDTNNNVVSYNYFKDSGQIYPSSTTYTNTPTSTGIFEVDFLRGTRQDNASSAYPGFFVSSQYVVNEIDARVNGSLTHKYALAYTPGANGSTTLLNTITETGWNASGTAVTLPAVTFTYKVQTPGWTSSSTWNPPVSFVDASATVDQGVRIMDVLGRNLPDLIKGFTSNGTTTYAAYLNNGAGWSASSTWYPPTAFSSGTDTGARVAGLSGDSLPDILQAVSSTPAAQLELSDGSVKALYHFNNQDLTDSSGNGRNGTQGGTPVTFTPGARLGPYAMATNGGNGSFNSVSSTMDLSGDFSIGFWLYPQASLNGSYFIYKNTPGTNNNTGISYGVSCTSGNLEFVHNGVCDNNFAYTLATSTWYWILVERHGSSQDFYVNDILKNNVTDATSSNIGSNTYFDGEAGGTGKGNFVMDETFFTNAAISTSTRDLLYASGTGAEICVTSGCANSTSSIASSTFAWTNNGHGWATSTVWNPVGNFVDASGSDTGLRIADLNGKGLPDLIQGKNVTSTTTYAAYLNDGAGWSANDPSWYPPLTFVSSTVNTGVVLVDINGDGLPDIVQAKSGAYNVYINNGHGWTFDPSWTLPPLPFIDPSGQDDGVRILDLNGDGLPDIVQGAPGNHVAYLNTGHGWATSTVWAPPADFIGSPGVDVGLRIMDVNGKGLPDLIKGMGTTYAAYINNGKYRANILTGVTYAQGGSSSIDYQSATPNISSGATLNKEPYPVYAVTSITNNDGSNDVSSSTYSYSGGTYYYGSPFDTRFAGFATVSSTDSMGNVTVTHYHTANGTDSSHGEYNDNYWKIGEPYRIEQYDNAGNIFKKTINRWDSFALGGNAGFVKLASSTEMDYDGLGTHKDLAEAYTYDNTTGNMTQKVQYGQVNANDDGTFTDTGTDDFTTAISYATSTTGVIGKPYDVTVTDHGSNKVKEARSYYDNLALGNVNVGNLTKEEDWKTGTTYVNVQNTYNSYGLVTQHLDERGKATNITYDSNYLYPATSTNPLSQSTGYLYDYSLGKTTRTTDPNGNMLQTVYDGLGRPLTVTAPDPSNSGSQATSTAFLYTDTANAVAVHETDYLSATTTLDAYTYYDGLNRPIQTRKSAEDSNNYKVSDRAYNTIDVLQKESLPYIATGTAKTSATTTATLFTNYTYDALKRVLTIGNAVGTTTVAYANWKVTTTDANGKKKDAIKDAYGDLVEVDEHNGTSTYTTTYTYDGLKDLTNITDALGNVRNFTYDGLARRLTAQDLHPSTSTTYGTWTYTYDDASNLTQQVDPKNQTVNYTYDDVNRQLSENYTGQAGGPQFTYTYDTCTQGVGHICIASSTDAVTTSTYNALGQLIGETKTIGTSTYTTNYISDRQGNKLTVTNPDNSQVKYTYNTAGLAETVAYQPNGGSSANVITNFDYSPTDQVASIAYANGVNATNTYDATKLYRLTQKLSTSAAGSQTQNISYTYDAVGNITQISDASVSGAAKTVTYTYDDLSRLLTATTSNVSTTPSYAQTFTYDALGNVLSGPAGTYTYGGTGYPNPDAVTAITPPASASSGVEISDGSVQGLFHFDASDLTNTVTSTRNGVQGGTPFLFTTTSTKLGAAAANTQSTGKFTASSTILDLSGDFTIGFWMNPQASLASGVYFFLRNTGGSNNNTGISYAISCTAGNIEFVHNGTCEINTAQTFNTNTWYWILAERQGSRLDFYVNDSLVQSVTDSLTAQSSTVDVCFNEECGGTGQKNFLADEWFFTKAAISTSTRNSLYASGSGAEVCITAGCGGGSSGTTVSSTYAYDNNGNLVNSANATNTWNWRNQLTQSVTASGTSSFAYDNASNRVKLVEGSNTTLFPTQAYNVMQGGAATTTKHIFANGILLATVTDASSTSATRYVLDDHLGGSNVVTDASGTVVETLDYYPYGQARMDTQTAPYGGEKRKFIGQQYDAATQLDYLNARYYDGSRGQFLSEDPMFLTLGSPSQLMQSWRQNQPLLLADPQSLNAYSYSEDNPIIKSDPTGRFAFIPLFIAIGVGAVLPQSAGGDMDKNGNLVPVGGMNNAEIYGTTALIAGGGQFQLLSTMAKAFTFRQIAVGVMTAVGVVDSLESIYNAFTLNGSPDQGYPTNASDIKKIKVVPPQPLEWTSGSPIITSAPSNGGAQQVQVGNQGGGGTGSGGGSSGGNPRYIFSGGKNIYNQTLQDVFPGYSGKVGSQ